MTPRDDWDQPDMPAEPSDDSSRPAEPRPPTDPTLPANASFSERYRGTEWGQPRAAPQVARSQGPGPRSGALVVGAAVLALVAVGGIAFTILAGGGPGPGVPAGAVRLPPEDAPASSAPSHPVTRAGVTNAFIKRVTAKDFGYGVDFSAAFTATEYMNYEIASMSGAMDIRGQDFSGNWRVHVITGKNAEVAMVYKGKNGYVRPPEEDWECAAPKTPRPQVNAFAGMSKTDDVRYEGIKTKNGARLHQLRAVSPLRINPWVLQDPEWASASAIRGLIYDIFVTDDGMPVSATFSARIRVPDPDGVGKTELKIVADYRFRNVGRAVTITAPAGVCNTQAGA